MSVPKLRLPFRVSGGRAAVVEQDSADEVIQCVYAVLATEPEQRQELPEFGVIDQALRQGGADLEELAAAVALWEPRAALLSEVQWRDLLEKVRVEVELVR